DVAAKIESENTGILEKPVLRFLRVFRVAKGVGNDERGNAAGLEQFVSALDKRDKEVPLLPERFVLLAGEDLPALALVPLRLLVGTDIGRVANRDVKAVFDSEH